MIPRGKIKDKKSAILMASLEVIANNGFHASSIKQISEHAKVAAGTIYVYFKNKDELIQNIFISIRKEITQVLVSGYDRDLDFAQNYKNLWKEVYRFYIDNPLKFMFLEQYSSSPYYSGLDNQQGANALNPALELFKDAKDAGYLKDMSVNILLALSHGPIISLVRMHLMKEINVKRELDLDKYIAATYQSISV